MSPAVVGVLLGLVWGSFVGLLADRVPSGGSPLGPRSHCIACGRILGVIDLVPVVSWVLLRGRCRTCRERIPVRSTLIEIACAGIGAAAALSFPDPSTAVLVGAAGGLLVGLSAIDLSVRRLPNAIVYPASAVAFGVVLIGGGVLGAPFEVRTAALGAVMFGGGLWAIAVISRGGMGMGDVKLGAFIGWVLGALDLRAVGVAAAAAVVFGGSAGIVALARGASRRDALPFGPMLAAGALVGAFLGGTLADSYLAWLR